MSFTSGLIHRSAGGSRLSWQAGLLEMVRVEVCIAEGVYELARLVAATCASIIGEQRIDAMLKGTLREDVGRALVELALFCRWRRRTGTGSGRAAGPC